MTSDRLGGGWRRSLAARSAERQRGLAFARAWRERREIQSYLDGIYGPASDGER